MAAACTPSPPPSPSLVVVVIDTLRADELSLYGHDAQTSPNLDAFAAGGTVFRHAVAASPWTGPSVASIVTGRLPDQLGIRRLQDPLPPASLTLAEILSAQGYWTGAVVSNGYAGPQFLQDQGYERYVFHPYKSLGESPEERRPSFTADRVSDRALELLHEATRPFFLYVHYTDPHAPYLAPSSWRARFVAPGQRVAEKVLLTLEGRKFRGERLDAVRAHYDAEIGFVDHEVGRFLQAIPEDVVVVVTADHGEAFMEHGLLLHGNSIHQELLHVPMIWRGPGVPVAHEVDAIASHVDVLPTALDLLRIEPPADLAGHSLVAQWEASSPTAPPRVVFSVWGKGPEQDVAARDRRWTLISTPKRSWLYDRRADPWERTDVARDYPSAAARLRAAVKARPVSPEAKPYDDGPAMRAGREDALRALGYIE